VAIVDWQSKHNPPRRRLGVSIKEFAWLAPGRLEAARYGRQDACRYELEAAMWQWPSANILPDNR
jgi:hypothetical protein